ncbi:SRPBCC domain-containing protein [Rufibacter quisquiliarum]|uniref:PhnB protein n=1 Tax=Rufibacter quisquiliarum TaxID=1549639 RepID=A0A839GEL7_9BACT|nr:SRPBCC domain-containing protein [Rufibacter quisquiliarum]MBA9076900.1 PhnB protein [Rufibacter quisquiliarum]
MNKAILFNFEVEKENNLIKVERSFQAPKDLVWAAWTEADILDQWWAPKPWQAVTKAMDFTEGGRWHYYMQGPEGERHWCLFEYKQIQPQVFYAGIDAFCDENAVLHPSMPRVTWKNTFTAKGDSTVVHVRMQFEKLEDLETIIQMGFKEGFTAGLENLDQYIAAQFYLRKQNKPNHKARVTNYINLPGTTEEAFNFYKSVFKTEFVNGIKRFGEIPTAPGQPPVAEEIKRMVLHVELPLLGDYVLMGTDAPKEMGFTLSKGNNMHISLEPESMEEATRLFNELSKEGEIEMPLQEMFYGAYYAGFTDKYGINWMINYQNN